MNSALRVLIRAAQPIQRRPSGTQDSRPMWPRHGRPVGPNVPDPQKQSLDQRDREFRVSTRHTEEKFTAALVHSAEARAVVVSPGTQESLVMLEAVLMAAKHKRVRTRTTGQRLVDVVAGDQSTDRHSDTDIDIRVTSQPCFLGLEAGANALARKLFTKTERLKESTSAHRERGKVKLTSSKDAKRLSSFRLKDV